MTCKYLECKTARPLDSTYETEMGWHVPCLNKKHKKDRSSVTQWTNKSPAERAKQGAYSKTRRAKAKQEVEG